MEKNNIEKRFIETEIRADKESRIIEGYAIKFNTESRNLGGFTEIIKPDAISEELIKRSDIKLVFNHNENLGILGRSKKGKGTLNILKDEEGVYFRAELPDTQLGNDILTSVNRGDLDSCSFKFAIKEDGRTWEKDGSNWRCYVNKIEDLMDFSVVVNPAYEDAKLVSKRSLDEFEKIKLEEETNKIEEEKKKKEKFEKYYNNLINKYLK